MTDDPITAILDQLAAHAEQISALDARQAGHAAAVTSQLAALAARLDAQLVPVAEPGVEPGDGQAGGRGTRPGAPAPVRRWWKLAGQDRAEAIQTLRAWVEQVYQPGYGQLAAALAPCWDQHPLCLYAIDILAELWSVLYLAARRSPAMLSAQAEYQARILPALAEQMSAETTRCRHLGPLPARGHGGRRP
jgi:hypothetical protein